MEKKLFYTILVLTSKPISCNARSFQNNKMPAKWIIPDKLWNWNQGGNLEQPKNETSVPWHSGERKKATSTRSHYQEEASSSRSLFGPEVTDGGKTRGGIWS